MNKILVSVASAFAVIAVALAASPAATQAWVIDYVSKNGGGGGGRTADYSTNTVNGIINNIFLEASLARVSATNAAYKVTTAATTNERYRVLAPISVNAWTNVVGISFSTNSTTATYRYGAAVFTTTNFTASVINFYANATTNRPSVVVLPYSATDAEIKEAKGEN